MRRQLFVDMKGADRQDGSVPDDDMHGSPVRPRDDGRRSTGDLPARTPAQIDHQSMLDALAADAGRNELLRALALVNGVRAHLDDLERQLIESARDAKASWAQIASSLGVASRQAAEQRWLRLSGESARDPGQARSNRRRQRNADEIHGNLIAHLRAAVRAVHRQLSVDPTWDGHHPRAPLARKTLALARTAEPGALFALATQAVEDLDAVPAQQLSPPVEVALKRLREAVTAARPQQS